MNDHGVVWIDGRALNIRHPRFNIPDGVAVFRGAPRGLTYHNASEEILQIQSDEIVVWVPETGSVSFDEDEFLSILKGD